MAKATILLIDNDLDFLITRREFLEKEGYKVVAASSPEEANASLKGEKVDLAIVDIRLFNDDDEKDNSGLELAKELRRFFPVIILTGYPSSEYMRQALASQIDGTRVAYDFLAKVDGPMALLSAIQKTLEINRQPRIKRGGDTLEAELKSSTKKVVRLSVSEQMRKDYETARLIARRISLVRLGLVISGAVVLFVGIIALIMGYTDVGIITAIGGIITGTLGGLNTKLLSNDANRRWEQFHKELMLLYKKSNDARKKDNKNK